MGRKKQINRKKGTHSTEMMLKAIMLNRNGMSIRKAAKEGKVSYSALQRYVKKYASVSTDQMHYQRLTPNYEVNKIFSESQEEELKDYIKDCALKFYGLRTKDLRRVAYQMAAINKIDVAELWKKEKMAGFEWLRSFRRRHPDLSLKKPEACSLARATSFNKENVAKFFDNLKAVMERHPTFGNGCRIYNLDETATTTVQKPHKVIAPKGKQNIGRITSGEKGTLVTTCAIVCASGQALPPVLVFPRKNYKEHMLKGAPPGSLGLANPTGWMNAELFVKVIEHFVRNTSANLNNPALLVMDNHESHLSIEALDLAKKNGVTVLTLHPHTTAKMQPLDVGLNGPFKVYYNSAVDSWLLRNPGLPMTIYEIAECVGLAYSKAMTPINITSAFKKTGIFPFDADIFTDIDFMPSEVTDREQPQESFQLMNRESMVTPMLDVTNIGSPSRNDPGSFVSPKNFMPALKAGPRTGKRKPRKLGKSLIATDTPVKDEIAECRNKTKERKAKANKIKRPVFNSESADSLKPKRQRKQVEIISESETSEDENIPVYLTDSDDVSITGGNDSDDDEFMVISGKFEDLNHKPRENDYVLVLFHTKKINVYYVAVIVEVIDVQRYMVSYMRVKSKQNMKFTMPVEPDLAEVNISEIKMILPSPKITGTKSRNSFYIFPIRVAPNLNLR